MKKWFIFAAVFMFLSCNASFAHYRYLPPPPPPPPVVPVATYVNNYQEYFPGCEEHTLLINEVVTEYSDYTTSSARIYSVMDSNGFIILANADYIEHLYKGSEHYFLARIDRNYQIINTYGKITSPQGYTTAVFLTDDRIKVGKNLSFLKAGYGIIDYSGKEIVPVKYQSIKAGDFNNGLYVTKLNGYYGLLDLNNHIYLRNEYDSIKEIHSAYLLKKEGKYGLADSSGNLILEAKYDKIKKLGDYIIVKDDNKLWAAYDGEGNCLAPFKYKKIKLDRNTLVGHTKDSKETIAK